MNRRLLRFTAPACLTLLLSPALQAEDHILTIGGGYSPAGNQVSLERNVIFFRKLLSERLPEETKHDLYFADGSSTNPDLQFQLEGDEIPKANRYMAGLFGTEEDLENHYRNNALEDIRGVSSPEDVETWFKKTGSTMKDGDRLILYVTAHGGRSGSKGNKFNTKIYMWNRKSMEAAKLSSLIDGLPKGVSVMTVMVQCYSGGFSHLIFDGHDAKKGDRGRSVCGFFATVCDREAAGCTPDVNEENYDEFSSHFWAAIRGKTRMGKSLEAGDFDGDGIISFEEAHAHAILASRNIDIPVKTSDAFLRKHSKMDGKEDHLSLQTPYPQLLKLASPSEHAVMDGLSAQLDLKGDDRGSVVGKKAEKMHKELKELEGKLREQKKKLDGLRREVGRDMRNQWPQLSNTYSPGAVQLLQEKAKQEEFVQGVEKHPKFKAWRGQVAERAQLEEKELELGRSYATHQRFVTVLENVALAANLAKVADADVRARYERLLEAEGATLGK
jgi:hypothetical protein